MLQEIVGNDPGVIAVTSGLDWEGNDTDPVSGMSLPEKMITVGLPSSPMIV
jgi:hypothetical protein